jgi:cell division control protein 45
MYYANAVSGMVYQLGNQLSKTNNELLWAAIVGVTAQYIFERIDTQKYLSNLQVFKDDRERLDTQPLLQSGKTANISIKAEVEYRFMMFRHWSLYDSMYHSGYVSSKLGVWKEAGKKRLNNMFAKMG